MMSNNEATILNIVLTVENNNNFQGTTMEKLVQKRMNTEWVSVS